LEGSGGSKRVVRDSRESESVFGWVGKGILSAIVETEGVICMRWETERCSGW
jgi:hypothetical protein